ncbi:sensor histidine kinase [Roseomonas sp. GCM10028921]
MPQGPQNARLPAAPEAGPAETRSDARDAAPRWSFGQRLALVYGAVSLLIILCAAAFSARQASLLTARSEELAVAETRRLAERVGSTLARAAQGIATLAVAEPLARGAEGCGALLNAAHLTMDADVRHLFVTGPDGRVLCATLPGAAGRLADSPTLRTIQRTGRPANGLIGEAGLGLQGVIGVGHPLRRNGQPVGAVTAALSVEELRSTAAGEPAAIPGLRAWLLDAAGGSLSLLGPQGPIPALPEALHASFAAPEPVGAGRAAHGGTFFLKARVTDDLTLVATIPQHLLRAGAPLEVALPPLLLALILLLGMGALFWAVRRFVIAPIEAATRRLEAGEPLLPSGDGGPPGEVADLLRRLAVTRTGRDEAFALRDALLAEAQGRIRDHLALVATFLRLQERQLSDHAALQALRAAQGRILAIGTSYEMLEEGPGQLVPLEGMLGRFAHALAARDLTEGNATQIQMDLRPIEVRADVAVRTALIMNELVTNALRYAFIGRAPGTVRIALRSLAPADGAVQAGFTLLVTDNGAGMPDQPRRGLGMTVVDSLLRSIDARIERLPGPGTAFLVTWAGGGGEG